VYSGPVNYLDLARTGSVKCRDFTLEITQEKLVRVPPFQPKHGSGDAFWGLLTQIIDMKLF
jgi:hypothetical protein